MPIQVLCLRVCILALLDRPVAALLLQVVLLPIRAVALLVAARRRLEMLPLAVMLLRAVAVPPAVALLAVAIPDPVVDLIVVV
ncbi:MAG: hypothetical protein JSS83_24790 [Cyanobacteria bacterium SZAS LIN-3]|nr:hypothetical protein [Cyanobacteria bacterium SZAS LIN-3]